MDGHQNWKNTTLTLMPIKRLPESNMTGFNKIYALPCVNGNHQYAVMR
jgi:hypothetical protein